MAYNGDSLTPEIDLVSAGGDASFADPTSVKALDRLYFKDCMSMVEEAAVKTDESISYYLLLSVTEEYSYNFMKTNLNIPCGKDYFYERYRKFFFVLDKIRKNYNSYNRNKSYL